MEFNFTPEEIANSKMAFASAYKVYKQMLSVYDDIMANKEVCKVINKEIRMPQPNGKDVDMQYKVILVFFIDLIKCYQNMGHEINFDNRDCFLLPMTTNIKFRQDMTTDIEFKYFMSLDEVKFLYTYLLRSFEGWARQDGSEFLFTRFAKDADKEICRKYLELMINSSGYIKAAKPTSIRMEYKWTADLKAIKF